MAPLEARIDPGLYLLEWTTAGPDDHIRNGSFSFEVLASAAAADSLSPQGSGQAGAEEALPPDPAGTETDREPSGGAAHQTEADPVRSFAGWLARFSSLLGSILLMGSAAFCAWALAPLSDRGKGAGKRCVRIALFGAAAVVLGAAIGTALYAQEAGLRDLAFLWSTRLGFSALLQGGAGLFAAAILLRPGVRGGASLSWGRILALPTCLLLPAALAITGHSWSREPRILSVILDHVHVLAASIWIGGLACLLAALLSSGVGRSPVKEGASTAELVDRYSLIARLCVAALLLSGWAGAFLYLDGVGQLFSTSWGRTLLWKAAVVLGVMGLGWMNWKMHLPQLRLEGKRASLLRAAAAELALAVVAVGLTAQLVTQALD